jgi:hypothetical protein
MTEPLFNETQHIPAIARITKRFERANRGSVVKSTNKSLSLPSRISLEIVNVWLRWGEEKNTFFFVIIKVEDIETSCTQMKLASRGYGQGKQCWNWKKRGKRASALLRVSVEKRIRQARTDRLWQNRKKTQSGVGMNGKMCNAKPQSSSYSLGSFLKLFCCVVRFFSSVLQT